MSSNPLIRFCINNAPTMVERRRLFELGYECRDCLGNCSACFEGRFLEAHDQFFDGDSYEEILAKIRAHKKTPRDEHEA